MNPLEENEFFRQVASYDVASYDVASNDAQLAGHAAHLRALGDGLYRTRHVIHRGVAACVQSKQLLAQIELAERKLRRS